MTVEELARMVLHTLKLQKDYFDTRNPMKLLESKDAERRLKKAAEEILFPPTPGLFDSA
jgi:hypothetical protein